MKIVILEDKLKVMRAVELGDILWLSKFLNPCGCRPILFIKSLVRIRKSSDAQEAALLQVGSIGVSIHEAVL